MDNEQKILLVFALVIIMMFLNLCSINEQNAKISDLKNRVFSMELKAAIQGKY